MHGSPSHSHHPHHPHSTQYPPHSQHHGPPPSSHHSNTVASAAGSSDNSLKAISSSFSLESIHPKGTPSATVGYKGYGVKHSPGLTAVTNVSEEEKKDGVLVVLFLYVELLCNDCLTPLTSFPFVQQKQTSLPWTTNCPILHLSPAPNPKMPPLHPTVMHPGNNFNKLLQWITMPCFVQFKSLKAMK